MGVGPAIGMTFPFSEMFHMSLPTNPSGISAESLQKYFRPNAREDAEFVIAEDEMSAKHKCRHGLFERDLHPHRSVAQKIRRAQRPLGHRTRRRNHRYFH